MSAIRLIAPVDMTTSMNSYRGASCQACSVTVTPLRIKKIVAKHLLKLECDLPPSGLLSCY